MNSLVSLLLVSLLCAPAVAVSAPLASTPSPASLRRDEVRLLHQALRPIDLGSNLKIWEPRAGEWLKTETSDPPAARVIVVYLWSAAAPAAIAELPWIRELARRVENHHGGDAHFMFVAEGVAPADMRPIAAAQRPLPPNQPQSPWFLDAEGLIPEGLRQALPGGSMPLPVTLLLDDHRIVRHAIVGSLAARRGELVSAVSDLLYQLRATRRQGP